MAQITSLEICSGAGGQALGLEQAGFSHVGLVEIDTHACQTLRHNRPDWQVHQADLHHFSGLPYKGVDLLAGGVPCPPFSKAGKQLGPSDDRDLFPQALRLVDEIRPRAVLLENVRGLMDGIFVEYRENINRQLNKMGYVSQWRLLNASDFGVSQLRPRLVMVAIQRGFSELFEWPVPHPIKPLTVGVLLKDMMGVDGWLGVHEWMEKANAIAPTIVGGSKKHGGPDLGPTRAKKAWETLGVNGHSIAEAPPEKHFVGMPRLTVKMVARIQGFSDDWVFSGKKTPAYRQVGNAFPPPVAQAVGQKLHDALVKTKTTRLIRAAI